MSTDTKWLIWSNEHRAWWGPDSKGYTPKRDQAGRYDFDEAVSICVGANYHLPNDHKPHEAMVPDSLLP